MAANTSAPCTAGTEPSPPYRLRKHVMRVPTLRSLSDAAALVERSGQQERVQRWTTTSRLLDELGLPCESLAELERVHKLAESSPQSGGEQEGLEQLQALVAQTAAVSARIGAGVQDVEFRTLCFALTRACQRTQLRIRSQRLWREER